MHHRHHHHHRRFPARGAALWALGLGLAAGMLGCNEAEAEPQSRVDALLARLDATDAEREVLRPLLRDLADDLDALRSRTAALRGDVVAGWRTDTLDPARLRERADVELDALRAAAGRISERIAALHAAMTPAQREQLARSVRHWRH